MKLKNKSSIAQPIGLALFVFFGAFMLSAFASHSFTPVGDSSAVESEVNVEIEPSLSLAIMNKDPSVSSDATTIDTMSMEVTPNASGVFINSTAYVVAGSNNETGYTLSFSDTDDNTALINTDPTVTTNIPSISSTSSSLTDITTNQWGYTFGDSTASNSGLANSTLATSFNPVPALSSPITLASTAIPASNVYPFTAASKIDMNVPAGTYQDSVVFSLVANFVPKTDIVLDKNESSYNPATLVSGTLLDSTGVDVITTGLNLDYNKKVVLPKVEDNTLTRLGYRFLGWDTDGSVTTPTYSDGDTIDYHTVNGSNTTSSVLTLYAIWQPKNFPTTLTTMQGMTSDICADVYTPTANSTTIEAIKADGSNYYYSADNVAQTTLYDVRDNEPYNIRKLADGKCWMTQNLRLARTKTVTLTSADSDVSSNFSLPKAPTTASSWGSATSAADVNQVHHYYAQNTNDGVYYNWFTTTAGAGLLSTSISTTSSICPKQWRLPTGGSSGDFQILYNAEGTSDTTFVSSGSWTLSGYYHYSNGLSRYNSYGLWWSNTPDSSTSTPYTGAYTLFRFASGINPQKGANEHKAYGFSVRCLAR